MDNKRIYNLIIFSFVIKAIIAWLVPIYADEAYYYVWSLHPQLSYFDHPPMVSWFIYLSELVLPFKNGLSLRFLFIVASTVTMFTWVKILKLKGCSEKSIFYFLILLLLNPLLGPGSIVATPDVPLVMFWSLSYYFFINVIECRKNLSYAWLGVVLGLGFCSKYHIVIFLICGIVYLLLTGKIKLISFRKSLITVFVGLIFSLPVLYWNYQNDWASFGFQLKHGLGRSYYKPEWTWGFILSQILIINPFLLKSIFRKATDRADQYFALTQFLFFITSSFKAVVEANWPITAHLHTSSAAAKDIQPSTFKMAVGYWVMVYIILISVFLLPQTQKLIKNQINSAQMLELVPVVQQYQPLYGPNYQISSLLTWLSGKEVFKLRGLTRHDFYDSIDQSLPKQKEFYVLKHMTSYWPESYYKTAKIELIQSFAKQEVELFKVTHE